MNTSTSNPPQINKLPHHLINQIKAGEVIERPAFLLKELLENSIDANSTKIDICIENSGLDLIQVIDNGHGIDFNSLPLAFERHSTSKISHFNDLYRLHSYGFRGEALASMASVSRVTCISQTKANGGQLELDAGKVLTHVSSSQNTIGTKISIRDLFFNTPARFKFIKSKTSEKNSLLKMFHSFLITYPHIEFSLKLDDNERIRFKQLQKNEHRKRIQEVFYKSKEPPLVSFDKTYEGYRVYGVFNEVAKRSSSKKQYIFINERLVEDRSLHQIILKSCQPKWEFGTSGDYFIFIKTPMESVDINVHPNKTKIKFEDGNQVYSLLSATLGDVFSRSERGHPPRESEGSHVNDLSISSMNFEDTHHIQLIDDKYGIIFDNLSYLIDLEGLLNFSFQYFLTASKSSDQVPLIIGLPFQISNIQEKYLRQLTGFGFEFDLLNEQVQILRSIPKWIGPYDYKALIHNYLTAGLFILPSQKIQLTPTQIYDIYKQLDTQTLIQNKFIIPLSSNFLQKVFQ